jgi:hypothetical protein
MQKQLNEKLNVHHNVAFEHIAEELLREIEFNNSWLGDPASKRTRRGFSDEEVILWENNYYILAALIWDVRTTNIHDHGFSGAFKVIDKDRYHFKFEKTGGHIKYSGFEVLKKDQIQMISKGDGFIHQIWHSDPNSITIILREKKRSDQKDYFAPFFSCKPTLSKLHQIELESVRNDWEQINQNEKIDLMFNILLYKPLELQLFLNDKFFPKNELERIRFSLEVQQKFMSLVGARRQQGPNQNAHISIDKLFRIANSAIE